MHPVLIGGVVVAGAYLVKQLFYGKEEIPTRRIFISHSWKKSTIEYKKFVKKLKIENINFFDHSIPEEKAFDTISRKELKQIFRKQMVYCSKVYVLAKNGIRKDSYVGVEIEIAKELKKEIIAVKPHGQHNMPPFIRQNANKVISNNIQSISKTLKS